MVDSASQAEDNLDDDSNICSTCTTAARRKQSPSENMWSRQSFTCQAIDWLQHKCDSGAEGGSLGSRPFLEAAQQSLGNGSTAWL